ncbi:MAG TPA: VOC family protein, partial [Bryobacteraceae bacterium]|nr:VOC family protein [Bryobacteraceae bacterium]
MVRVILLASIPMLLSAVELTIDHVTVAGKSLQDMQAALAAAGISSENGGPHSNHATEMALTSFPDGSYLELIALQSAADPQAVAAHAWSKLLQGDAGPAAWAVRVKDIAAEVERLKSAGVAVGTPVRSGRVRPDGVKLDWETAQVGKEPNGTFFPFLIRDYTDRKERAWPGRKPTTKDFSGVTRVVIAVQDLDEAVKRYQEAYGL